MSDAHARLMRLAASLDPALDLLDQATKAMQLPVTFPAGMRLYQGAVSVLAEGYRSVFADPELQTLVTDHLDDIRDGLQGALTSVAEALTEACAAKPVQNQAAIRARLERTHAAFLCVHLDLKAAATPAVGMVMR